MRRRRKYTCLNLLPGHTSAAKLPQVGPFLEPLTVSFSMLMHSTAHSAAHKTRCPAAAGLPSVADMASAKATYQERQRKHIIWCKIRLSLPNHGPTILKKHDNEIIHVHGGCCRRPRHKYLAGKATIIVLNPCNPYSVYSSFVTVPS